MESSCSLPVAEAGAVFYLFAAAAESCFWPALFTSPSLPIIGKVSISYVKFKLSLLVAFQR